MKTKDLIMLFIIEYIKEHGYPPSVREIGDGTELKSTSTVYNHLKALLEEGRLETDAEFGTPRAIRVKGWKFVKEEEE